MYIHVAKLKFMLLLQYMCMSKNLVYIIISQSSHVIFSMHVRKSGKHGRYGHACSDYVSDSATISESTILAEMVADVYILIIIIHQINQAFPVLVENMGRPGCEAN